MLYGYVVKEWMKGNVSVGLPAVAHGDDVYIEGKGFLLGIACSLLSNREKEKLAELSKKDARKIKAKNDEFTNY